MIFERHNNFERLILIGMPCSGKTSIGKYLAQHYRLDFYDMDEEIVKAAGMSIQEIFEKKGEPAFRELETKTAISLSEKQNALIATGGGIVTRENNMQYFSGAMRLCLMHKRTAPCKYLFCEHCSAYNACIIAHLRKANLCMCNVLVEYMFLIALLNGTEEKFSCSRYAASNCNDVRIKAIYNVN